MIPTSGALQHKKQKPNKQKTNTVAFGFPIPNVNYRITVLGDVFGDLYEFYFILSPFLILYYCNVLYIKL